MSVRTRSCLKKGERDSREAWSSFLQLLGPASRNAVLFALLATAACSSRGSSRGDGGDRETIGPSRQAVTRASPYSQVMGRCSATLHPPRPKARSHEPTGNHAPPDH